MNQSLLHRPPEMDLPPPRPFKTTRWSLIDKAISEDGDAARALAEFCVNYRSPLLSYARKFVTRPQDAEDLVQGFFLKLLEKNFLAQADSSRGRLRTFLLTLLQRHIADEYRRETAEKRGGKIRAESLDDQLHLASGDLDPEQQFHRHWALTVLERSLLRLRSEWEGAGKLSLFEALKPTLGFRSEEDADRARVAADFSMSEGAVNTAIYRLRREFRSIILREIAETLDVKTKEEAENELKTLLGKV